MTKKIILFYSLLLSLSGPIAHAHESKKFLEEFFMGGVAERTHIVRDIDELDFARTAGKTGVLLSGCANFRTVDSRPDFDLYIEELRNVLYEKSEKFNALNGFFNLSLAAALNQFSDKEIELIKTLRSRGNYPDIMSYIWFYQGMWKLSEGLEDVNTGIKQPWIAARTLHYLKNHKLYPLFLGTLSVEEKALLDEGVLTSMQPAVTVKEVQYTEALSQLFKKHLEGKALFRALPADTAVFVHVLQSGIDPESKRANASFSVLGEIPVNLVCKSSDAKNCVSNEWFNKGKSIYNKNLSERFLIASTLLKEKYNGLCESSLSSSQK